MHGSLKIGVQTPHLKIESKWEGLANPELDPGHVEGGAEGIMDHASTRMKESGNWATVRVEGRDWGRVLGVGRLGGRVIACKWLSNFLSSCSFCYFCLWGLWRLHRQKPGTEATQLSC